MDRPLLLLDVDGVLQPVGRSVPPGYRRIVTDDAEVVLNPDHGRWLSPLLDRCDGVWATTWAERADVLIGAHLGLPGLGHLGLGEMPRHGTRKLTAVQRHVGDRPLIWIDDELYDDAEAWAAARPAPTLLVRTRPSVGLTRADVDTIESWFSSW